MTHTDDLPRGFRALTAEEGERLDEQQFVLVYDRGLNAVVRYIPVSYNPHRGWRCVIRDSNREVVDSIWLDDDNPDFWPDDEIYHLTGQRGPESTNGNYVAVTLIDPGDLIPLLEQSFYPTLAKEVQAELARDEETPDEQRDREEQDDMEWAREHDSHDSSRILK